MAQSISIVGAGIGGLSTALALEKRLACSSFRGS